MPSFSAAIANESLVLVDGSSNFKIAKESKFSALASNVLVTSISYTKCLLFTS